MGSDGSDARRLTTVADWDGSPEWSADGTALYFYSARPRELPGPQQRHQKLKPGDIFVVRTSPVMWAHTGFVLAVHDDSFDTIEGNTGTDGGFNGANAKTLRRKFANIDFLHLR